MYLWIDIWSVSIKFAIIDDKLNILEYDYFRTHWDLIKSIKKLLNKIKSKEIKSIVTTWSARKMIKKIIDADFDVDEITSHRTAIKYFYPEVKTIFEIWWQDSKLIYFDENNVNFEMNNVCAAWTWSFLDQQASRLGLNIEDFYKKWLESIESHNIASKCTVFAETDMIHAQQSWVPIDQIIRWVHKWMINNYFSTLCRWKKLKWKFLFEWWTSLNKLLVEELTNKLIIEWYINKKDDLIVPEKYNTVIWALWAAIIWKQKNINNKKELIKINNYKFIWNEECYNFKNKCWAKLTKIIINNKELIIWKSCEN